MIPFLHRALVPLLATVILLYASTGISPVAATGGFEVWLIDQSDTNGQAYGGAIHIYDGDDLTGDANVPSTVVETLDLSGATSSMCMASTGANPVRPHMLSFNSTQRYAILTFVASGHIAIFNAETRAPVACLRASVGANGERQAHAATPAPDDTYILVANQNGKLLERIDTDYATETFTLNAGATIDLATCVTPNGAPCEDTGLRPDNAPIVAVVDSSSSLGFITLRGGGLFVIDPQATPMRILAEYDRTIIHSHGFAGAEAADTMFVNSGGGSKAHMHGFALYGFPLSGYDSANDPNTPVPDVLYSDENGESDAHGLVLTGDGGFLWVLDRTRNVAVVFDTGTGARANTVDLGVGTPAGLTPDLADVSLDGNYLFVSLRGPNPLSGDPHASTGSTPGLAVIGITENGLNGAVQRVVPIHNLDADGVERADTHGIRVRLK